MQRVVLKFRKRGQQWSSDRFALSHLEALISLWMYSYIYRQQWDEIDYHGDDPPFPTMVSWNYPDQKLLLDFLTIIGHKKATKKLCNLMNMGKLSTQNIVEIATGRTKFDTREIPRNHIPIFLDPDEELENYPTHRAARKPVFIPLEHLFGQEYRIANGVHHHDGQVESTDKEYGIYNPLYHPGRQIEPTYEVDGHGPLFAYKYLSNPGKSYFPFSY